MQLDTDHQRKEPLSMTMFRHTLIAAAVLLAPALAAAQQPDAGQTLQQERQQAPQLPRSGPAVSIPSPSPSAVTPGGAETTLTGIAINGATVFTEAQLLAVLGDVTGKQYDLAGLRSLADRLAAHYRMNGYPFARALIPEQTLKGGTLRITVVEGRYGRVRAIGDPNLAAPAQGFLSSLKTGNAITSDDLERATLILDDQPGSKIAPIIRPGQEIGTGDLDVRVEKTPKFSGDLGVGNHGNRYTGEYRGRANFLWNSPFTFGDQLTASILYSDENMWLGSVGYSIPLGTSGLRGTAGYSHTYYELGKSYTALDATGTADVGSLGITYPIIRSQKTNLTLAATYQHKALDDKQGSVGSDGSKSSDSMPLALNFDRRDGLGGGGIIYGSISCATGWLNLDGALEKSDRTSGQNTRDAFYKWNIDVARVQAIPVPNLTLFGRFSGQWTTTNLDSSESFGLGGADGVRAYPSGEGYGDEGWLVQLEMRYALGPFSPYAFYDAGQIWINADTGHLTAATGSNDRQVAGAGVGLRYNKGPWNLDAALAWRTQGGAPQSDSEDRNPRFWLTAGYRF